MPRKKKTREEVYHVEVITKARVSEEGEWEYFVKWAGYDSDADSWEPSENVQQCDRLLASFWKHIGMDDKDYPLGYEVAAEESWIDKEKRYFAETFVKPSKSKSVKGSNKDVRRSKSTSSESTAYFSQSSDEALQAKTPVKKKLGKKPRVIADPESDDSLGEQVRPQKGTIFPAKVFLKVPAPPRRPEVPSAGGSAPDAPPKAPVIRTHQDQRTNPLVKSMDMPTRGVEAGSSLSTKQRVAAGILPPPTGPKPLPHIPKKPLPPLSFKKNKPSVQTKDSIIPSPSVATPNSSVALPVNETDVVASPQSMDVDEPADLFGPIWDDVGPVTKSPENMPASVPPSKSQGEIDAEAFLQTMNIPELSAPLGMDLAAKHDQPAAGLSKTSAIPKIPKKWKWSGDLFVTTFESKTELLCAITISDPSGTSNNSHINLLLSPLDSLQISKLYPIMVLFPFLRICGKPQYFGRLESSEPSKQEIIAGFEHHLIDEELVAMVPLLLDSTEVAVLLVISPRTLQELNKFLQVPEYLSEAPLLVVLLPFLVSKKASTDAIGQRSVETVQQFLFSPQDRLKPDNFHQKATLHQAMSLLCFPQELLEFLNFSPPSRTYCIWPSLNQQPSSLDTNLLQYILKSTKAVLVRPEEDVRVIFISNRHLDALHSMPSLASRRANFPEIQFWTYGYSINMTSEKWRVQEIYPLGGIVTFTPSAIAEDLVGCHQLISQIIEHPLWDCYLIPEALVVSHVLFNNGNLGTNSETCLGPILDLISQGSISLMRMPERGFPDQAAWLAQLFNLSNATGPEMLEEFLGTFLKNQSITTGMTNEQLSTFANTEIIKDLSNAQTQPAFMESYRRYVVVGASTENAVPFVKDGLEWSSLTQFSFKDDYFQ